MPNLAADNIENVEVICFCNNKATSRFPIQFQQAIKMLKAMSALFIAQNENAHM